MNSTILKLGMVLWLLIPVSTLAQTTEVRVEVFPSTLMFSYGGEKRNGYVVVQNRSSHKLTRIKLSWLPEPNLIIHTDSTELESLGPGSDIGWPVTITATKAGVRPTAIYFRIDYQDSEAQSQSLVPHMVVGPLAVQYAPPVETEALAALEVKTTLELLSEQRPGNLYLVLTNKSAFELTAGPIRGYSPKFIQLSEESVGSQVSEESTGGLRVAVPPHSYKAIKMIVKAIDRVVPGKHLMVFEVPLSWSMGGQINDRTLVVTRFCRHLLEP